MAVNLQGIPTCVLSRTSFRYSCILTEFLPLRDFQPAHRRYLIPRRQNPAIMWTVTFCTALGDIVTIYEVDGFELYA